MWFYCVFITRLSYLATSSPKMNSDLGICLEVYTSGKHANKQYYFNLFIEKCLLKTTQKFNSG